MLFPTIQFGIFFAVVLTVSWLLMPRQQVWKPFMLAASYFFYGYADIRYMLLLAAVTVVNQSFAIGVSRATQELHRRCLLVGAVVADLGLLSWFKYYDFFVNSVAGLLDKVGLSAPMPLLHLALPVGISFFTFQAISYVFDCYRGDYTPASWLDFAVYQAFFPHLVAGPIVRAREFIPQLATPRDPRDVQVTRGLLLIMGGLIKKILLADILATRLVDPVFTVPGVHSRWEILAAIYGYAAQIYFDFSAYTDIATGLALLMGFVFPRNFNAPYRATSLQDFWRRWHMTLSRWLRDYLYVPLGGNRGGERRTERNLLITMLLGGLWHGAAWQFVIWGGLHGAGLTIERRWQQWRDGRATAALATATPGVPPPLPAAVAAARHVPPDPVPTERNAEDLVYAIEMEQPRDAADGGDDQRDRREDTVFAGAAAGMSASAGQRAAAAPAAPHPRAHDRIDVTVARPAPTASQAHHPVATGAGLGARPANGRGANVDAISDTPRPPGASGGAGGDTRSGGGFRWGPVVGWLLTFHLVCLAWIFFRAPDLSTVGTVLDRLVTGGGPSPLLTVPVLLAILAGIAIHFVPEGVHDEVRARFALLAPWQQGMLLGFLIVVIDVLANNQGVAPFIYFRF